MKLKKVKIVIRSLENIKKDWKQALRGERILARKKDAIVFPNVETFGRVLTPKRLSLLQAIITRRPKSLYELAKAVGRDFKNVHADIRILAEVGFIELASARGGRASITPVPKYSGYELDLSA